MRVFKFILYSMVLLMLLLTACGRLPREVAVVFPDQDDGRRAWTSLLPLQQLKGTAVFSWRLLDGSQGKHKIRLFLEPPGKLKVQWLMPFGGVAAQILIKDGQFWFSDARRQRTWQGAVSEMDGLFHQQGRLGWWLPTVFFTDWQLLLSRPPEDDEQLSAKGALADYLVQDEGLTLIKVVRFADGQEIHIRLSELLEQRGRVFARRFEILGNNARIILELSDFNLDDPLPATTFVYNLHHFNLIKTADETLTP
ncbi:MAG: hypothetical protein JXR89_02980 [Deltaproteobacteria bacterium]|nr:hypothetical protein [Deltaproteobacteria bacterium]